MEKWLLGFGAQSCEVSPQASYFRLTRMSLQKDSNETPASKYSQERVSPLPDIMHVPWAPYLVGYVPARAKMSSKADGLSHNPGNLSTTF